MYIALSFHFNFQYFNIQHFNFQYFNFQYFNSFPIFCLELKCLLCMCSTAWSAMVFFNTISTFTLGRFSHMLHIFPSCSSLTEYRRAAIRSDFRKCSDCGWPLTNRLILFTFFRFWDALLPQCFWHACMQCVEARCQKCAATGFSPVFLFVDVEPVITRTLVEGLAGLTNKPSTAPKAGDYASTHFASKSCSKDIMLCCVFVAELDNRSHCFSTGHFGPWRFQFPTSCATCWWSPIVESEAVFTTWCHALLQVLLRLDGTLMNKVACSSR